MTGKRVEFANSLRGLAILSVLVAHLLGIFWQDRQGVASMIAADEMTVAEMATPWFISLLHSGPFEWGQLGVSLFFLVSGFVIPFSIASHTGTGFLVARVFRIVPTYMAGFAVTLLAIWLSGLYWGHVFPYSWAEVAAHAVPGFRELTWSRHIDFVVWTLEIEIKFYLVCALAAGWIRTGSKWVFAVPVMLFVVGLGARLAAQSVEPGGLQRLLLTLNFSSSYLIYMFIGTAMYLGWTGRISRIGTVCAVLGLFGLFCFERLAGVVPEPIIASYGIAVAIFALAAAYPALVERNRVLQFFARISFSLYVVHAVAGYAVMRIIIALGGGALEATLLALLMSVGIAMALHKLVETPSQVIGKSLAKNRWPLAVRAIESTS